MSRIASDEHQRLVSRFWHNYLSLLEKSSIPVKARPWYRKHVEEYIRAHQGVNLQHHLPQHMMSIYLQKAERQRFLSGDSGRSLMLFGCCLRN